MKILFVHQNFPGQFRQLAPALAAAGHEVRALAINRHPCAGVNLHLYRPQRRVTAGAHPLVGDFEAKLIRGEAAAAAMTALRQAGFSPDLVIANPGWGEALFVKDVWPDCKLVCLLEFFYRTTDSDHGFDPEFPSRSALPGARLRVKNAALLDAMNSMDLGVAPTRWQRSCLPQAFQPRIVEIFDGIDTDIVCPDTEARATLPDGSIVRHGDPVVTFVSRNLEPYRGYHSFMRALPSLMAQRPDVQVLIVGADGVSYGAAAPAGSTWKQIFLDEVTERVDASRLHFLGRLDYAAYLQVLRVSAAHVYLTYPFVLSWSCLEAMSAGAHVVGSATTPVRDYIEDGVNGTLVDFFDAQALADTVVRVLDGRTTDAALRQRARDTVVERCDLRRVALPRYRSALSELMGQAV